LTRAQYTLNGHPSNWTEITNLLRSKGIDLDHNRFLILQVRGRFLFPLFSDKDSLSLSLSTVSNRC
jgi:hypothetical protein